MFTVASRKAMKGTFDTLCFSCNSNHLLHVCNITYYLYTNINAKNDSNVGKYICKYSIHEAYGMSKNSQGPLAIFGCGKSLIFRGTDRYGSKPRAQSID